MTTLGTHKLIHPIEVTMRGADGVERTEELKHADFCVTLRSPKAKDLRVLDVHGDSPVAGSIALLERLSNLDAIEVENLDAEDFEALGNLLGPAARNGRITGETA